MAKTPTEKDVREHLLVVSDVVEEEGNEFLAEHVRWLARGQPSRQEQLVEYLEQIQQQEYNEEIRELTTEIAKEALDQNDGDAEAAKAAAHDIAWEHLDGVHRVIYTHEAVKSLALVDNWQAGIEEGIVDMAAPNAIEQLVFAAMLQEVEAGLSDEIERQAEAVEEEEDE